MPQHFLLSSAARTLTLASVARMSDEEAERVFIRLRWSDNDGKAFCPHRGCPTVYMARRPNGAPRWRCKEAYSLPGEVYTNNAESFFSRMRRAEIGHHHHLAGPYLLRFAQEAAWREDHRREPNGQVDRVVALAMANLPSVDFCGYWQRGK